MTENINNAAVAPTGIVEGVLTRIKQNERDRDRELKNYYKSMMGRKDVCYSQTQVCRLAVEFLMKKGYTSITSSEGIRKKLIKLGVIKSQRKKKK